MAWTKLSQTSSPGAGYQAVHVGDFWVFRGFQNVFAWKETAGQIEWKIDLDGDSLTTSRLIAKCGELAVTFADYGRKKGSKLMGIAPNSGELAWERAVPFHPDKQGLAMAAGIVVSRGLDEDRKPRFLLLDGSSGEVLFNLPGKNGAAIVGDGGHAFASSAEGVWRLEVASGRLDLLADGDVAALASKTGAIYFVARADSQDRGEVTWYDKLADRVVSTVSLDITSNMISILPTHRDHQIVISLGVGNGLAMVDFEKKGVAWESGKENQWTATSCVWTPCGIVCVVRDADDDSRVVALETDTGKVLSQLPTMKLPERVFFHDGTLIVSGLAGTESFAYESH